MSPLRNMPTPAVGMAPDLESQPQNLPMLHVVIMAGGAGTRFWPESRAARPKQLLPLAGLRSMLQMTVDRLGDLASRDKLWILTNSAIVDAVHSQLPDVPTKQIVGEPCKRDTAPCIGLA